MKDEFKAYMENKLTFDHFLNEKHVYHDSNNKPCSLNMMCIREPAWSANMIRTMAAKMLSSQSLKSQEPLRIWLRDIHHLISTIVLCEARKDEEVMHSKAMNALIELQDNGIFSEEQICKLLKIDRLAWRDFKCVQAFVNEVLSYPKM